MEHRTALAIAGGITLAFASVAVAVGVNLGLVSGADPTSGPGTFEPTAELATTGSVAGAPPTTVATQAPITVYVDEFGNLIDPAAPPADPSGPDATGEQRDIVDPSIGGAVLGGEGRDEGEDEDEDGGHEDGGRAEEHDDD